MLKKNSKKEDLKWIEEKNIKFENIRNLDDDILVNLSLFKNSISNVNLESLEGVLNHSPKLTRPDAFYINQESNIIVGYEHFNITSSIEDELGSKLMVSAGRISEKKLLTKELYFTVSTRSGEKFTYGEIVDKDDTFGISRVPWHIESELLVRNSLSPLKKDLVVSEFNEISMKNVIKSIKSNLNNHFKKIEFYIENLVIEGEHLDVKFNFVIDMSNIVIPSSIYKQDGYSIRENFLNKHGMKIVIEEISDDFEKIFNYKKDLDVGIFMIIPNAFSICKEEDNEEDYLIFQIPQYSVYYFRNFSDVCCFFNEDRTGKSSIDEEFSFEQGQYSIYSPKDFKTSEKLKYKDAILLKKSI